MSQTFLHCHAQSNEYVDIFELIQNLYRNSRNYYQEKSLSTEDFSCFSMFKMQMANGLSDYNTFTHGIAMRTLKIHFICASKCIAPLAFRL